MEGFAPIDMVLHRGAEGTVCSMYYSLANEVELQLKAARPCDVKSIRLTMPSERSLQLL